MEDMENAEIFMHQYNDIDFVEVKDTGESSLTVAEDLAFIIENTDIHEAEIESRSKILDIELQQSSFDSSSSSEDDDSDVQIIAVKKTSPLKITGPTICIYSSSEDEKATNLGKQVKSVSTIHDSTVVGNLLSQLVLQVDKICKGKYNDKALTSDNDDESDKEDGTEQERCDLALILKDEDRVIDQIPKVRNETLPEELPEDNDNVSLTSEDNLLQLGVISALVETMIVIEASKSSPALDADTALFLDQDTFLGRIFDTFGPVKTPFYTVRSSKRVTNAQLEKGRKVYFVPFNQMITKYVFVEELKKMKGSDASWKDDCEPPPQHLDYSDDEEERQMRKELKNKKNNSDKLDWNDNVVHNIDGGRKKPLRPKGVYRQQGNALLEHAYQSNFHQKGVASNKSVKSQAGQPMKGRSVQNESSNHCYQDLNRKYQHRHQIPLDAYYDHYTSQSESSSQPTTISNCGVNPQNRNTTQVASQNTNDVSQTIIASNNNTARQNPYLQSFMELAAPHTTPIVSQTNPSQSHNPHHVIQNWQPHPQSQHVEQYNQQNNTCQPTSFIHRHHELQVQNSNSPVLYQSASGNNSHSREGNTRLTQVPPPVYRFNRPPFAGIVRGNMVSSNLQHNQQSIYNSPNVPPNTRMPYNPMFDSIRVPHGTHQPPPPPFMTPSMFPTNQHNMGGAPPPAYNSSVNLPPNNTHFRSNSQQSPQNLLNTRPHGQRPNLRYSGGHIIPPQRSNRFC